MNSSQEHLRFDSVRINTFSLCRCPQPVKRFLVVVVFQDTCTLIWPQFMRYSLSVVCAFKLKDVEFKFGNFYQSD